MNVHRSFLIVPVLTLVLGFVIGSISSPQRESDQRVEQIEREKEALLEVTEKWRDDWLEADTERLALKVEAATYKRKNRALENKLESSEVDREFLEKGIDFYSKKNERFMTGRGWVIHQCDDALKTIFSANWEQHLRRFFPSVGENLAGFYAGYTRARDFPASVVVTEKDWKPETKLWDPS